MARSKKRIKSFLKYIDWYRLIHVQWHILNVEESIQIENSIEQNIKKIRKFWKQYPDLRISQVLINLGIIPNLPGIWYMCEEKDLIIEQNISKPENYLIWTSLYTKNNKYRKKYKSKLVKNLSKSHILNIIKYAKERNRKIHPKYMEAFTNVLNNNTFRRKIYDIFNK